MVEGDYRRTSSPLTTLPQKEKSKGLKKIFGKYVPFKYSLKGFIIPFKLLRTDCISGKFKYFISNGDRFYVVLVTEKKEGRKNI